MGRCSTAPNRGSGRKPARRFGDAEPRRAPPNTRHPGLRAGVHNRDAGPSERHGRPRAPVVLAKARIHHTVPSSASWIPLRGRDGRRGGARITTLTIMEADTEAGMRGGPLFDGARPGLGEEAGETVRGRRAPPRPRTPVTPASVPGSIIAPPGHPSAAATQPTPARSPACALSGRGAWPPVTLSPRASRRREGAFAVQSRRERKIVCAQRTNIARSAIRRRFVPLPDERLTAPRGFTREAVTPR
ncbi:hypothetical protein GGQ63_001506 [Prosthecomicrobium pneumaticum]|uniref:Uncharacterized protein n=1 Tax=Prosthecomicrobium pneumaticum TaxID=81895 RepID=A0A7W9CV36_9HYPH|nr:hypothetical protein [Prosthecomicrobium pneumaticum]